MAPRKILLHLSKSRFHLGNQMKGKSFSKMALSFNFAAFLAALSAFISICSCSDAPNIVFILMDDIGFNDLGYNSVHSQIPTPNIDSLARSPGAVYFTQYYVHSLCTPSRASLMTGRYHLNTGLTNVLVPGTPIGLPASIQTLPEALKEKAGYRTAMTGKWYC